MRRGTHPHLRQKHPLSEGCRREQRQPEGGRWCVCVCARFHYEILRKWVSEIHIFPYDWRHMNLIRSPVAFDAVTACPNYLIVNYFLHYLWLNASQGFWGWISFRVCQKRREGGYTEIQVHSWDQNWRSTATAETQLSFAQFAQRFRIEIRGTARTCGQRFTVLASCNKQCQRHSCTKSTLTFRSQHLGESILCCAANPPWKTPKKTWHQL